MYKKIIFSIYLLVIICIELNNCTETTETISTGNSKNEKTTEVTLELKVEEKQQQQQQQQSHNKNVKPTQAGGLSPGVSDQDLDKLLMDKRYLTRQIKCALGQGACDPVGRRLKSLAPLVLRGACPKCTDTEKRQIQKTLAYIQKNYPKDWSRLMSTYTG